MHMLKHSSDSAVRDFYELERQRLGSSQRWSGVLAVELFEAEPARDAKPKDEQKPTAPRRNDVR